MKKMTLVLLITFGCSRHVAVSSNTNYTAQINDLQRQINDLRNLVDSLSTFSAQNQTEVLAIEAMMNQMTIQIAELNGFQHITGVIDPCGNHPTRWDEVLLKIYQPSTSSYQLVAVASDNPGGHNTRMIVVPAGGPYTTTDGDSCHFSVSPDGFTLINESHHY